jgi:hypothetical protein
VRGIKELLGNLVGKTHFNDNGRDNRITLNCVLEKWNMRVRKEWKLFRIISSGGHWC